MSSEHQSGVAEPERLKPVLHLKIERMNERQLAVVNRILLQLEAEELAERLGESFDRDQDDGKLARIDELVRQVRSQHGR